MIRKILLVVDLQSDFKDAGGEYERCLQYVCDHYKDYNYVVGTLFSQVPFWNENFQKHLHSDKCLNAGAQHVEYWTKTQAHLITKTSYSIPLDSFFMFCEKDDEIDIVGYGPEKGILASVFSLWDDGFENVTLLTDYIYSLEHEISKSIWLPLLKNNFGDWVH